MAEAIPTFENLSVTTAISDKKIQRALLPYHTGEEVSDLFDTPPDTGEDFATAKTKLDAYFDPKKNVEFKIFTFQRAKQNPGETANACHLNLMKKWNALWGPLERYYAPPFAGSKICVGSYATIVLLPIVLRVLPLLQPHFGRPIRIKLPNPVVVPRGESLDPAAMRLRDAQQKLRIKSQADFRRAIKDCDVKVGDTELIRQPKREKLSTSPDPNDRQ